MSEKTIVKEEPLPEEWQGRRVGLLDALCTVDSLFAFTNGWAANSQFNARFNEGQDEDWQEFLDWLRDVKKELPYEGWHVKYLRDCQGDHEKAALKFLDLTEYVDMKRPGSW